MTGGAVAQFKDQSFATRFQAMGDKAEGVAEVVFQQLGIKFERFGFNRPPFSMAALPANVRYKPDYITATTLVECQGFGRDGTFKLKREKLESLNWWAKEMPVDLFLWWSSRKQWAFVPLADVSAAVDDPERSTLGFFDPDTTKPKAYFGVAGAQLTDNWTKLEVAA